MNKARNLTNTTNKISLTKLINLMDHFDLHINPNLLTITESVDKPIPNDSYLQWTRTSFNLTQPLPAGTYTLSWQAKIMNDTNNKSDHKIRIRVYDDRKNRNIPNIPVAGVEFPLTDQRQSYTFNVPNDNYSYHLFAYGSGAGIPQTWTVIFYDCKLEIGDLANLIPLATTFERRRVV